MFKEIREANDRARQVADADRLDRLTVQQVHIAAQYLDFIDPLDEVSPEPIPHAHGPHEETARRCAAVAVMAFLFGWTVAYHLTIGSQDASWTVAFWSLLAVASADVVFRLGVTTIAPPLFIRKFGLLTVPIVAVIAMAGTVVLLGRIASPAIADLLVDILPWAWWALEFGLVLLTAVAWVGHHRFGTTARLTQQYHALEGDISRLRRRAGISRKTGVVHAAATTVGALIAALLVGAGAVDAQALMTDRTGSLLNRQAAEMLVVDALVVSGPDLPSLDIVLVSDHPMASPKMHVLWAVQTATGHLWFGPVVDANRRRVGEAVRRNVLAVLAADVPPAACTSIRNMIVRAALELSPVLLLTDGRDDCHSASSGLVTARNDIFVLLAPSKGDPADDVAVFEQRKAWLRRFAPNAVVMPLGLAPEAVALWAEASKDRLAHRLAVAAR